MNKKIITLIISLIVIFFLTIILGPNDSTDMEQEDDSPTTYQSINSTELSTMLESKDFQLIDVHIPEQSHIPNTDYFLPYNNIRNIQEQITDKDTKIVLYCRSGSMSKTAAQELVELGYTNVYELKDGLNEWISEGFEVVDDIRTGSQRELDQENEETNTNSYTQLEVLSHNSLEDCWVSMNDDVYEIPYEWTEQHPGGQEAFLQACGNDITDMIKIHTTNLPYEILEGFKIGSLQ